MALREVEGQLGPPWSRPIAGTFEQLVVESELLAGNPLGDPSRRPLYVYRSPGAARNRTSGTPAVYLLQGYSGQLDTWLARKAFEPTFIERLDSTFSDGDCPDTIVVFLDAWTARGGSQFINSASTGPYMDYICDEVFPFVAERYEHGPRALAGGSSGGYGAMVVSMLRPDVVDAFASVAGDALFEYSYLPAFAGAARKLRDHFDGSYEVFFERLRQADRFDWSKFGDVLMVYGCACCFSPDPERPGEALLPFEIATAQLVPSVWEQWLAWDPVRMAPEHAEALRGMRRIHLDAGKRDEYFLDLGAQAFARELQKAGVEHTLELFDGDHGDLRYRYPAAIRELVVALSG